MMCDKALIVSKSQIYKVETSASFSHIYHVFYASVHAKSIVNQLKFIGGH